MSDLREYKSLTTRYEEPKKYETFRKYYLIFEGANTERKYFQGINEFKKELGINNRIELVFIDKSGNQKHHSNPSQLLQIIEVKKNTLKRDGIYDKKRDKFVIVFDRDSFLNKESYDEFALKASKDNLLTVTSPCFELWLILHFENSIINHIIPNYSQIFENEKISNAHTFTSKLFSDISGKNPKTASFFNALKTKVNIAINQEKGLEQEYEVMGEKIGSNVGCLIEEMMQDPRDFI